MKKTGTRLLFLGLLALSILPAGALPETSTREAEDRQVMASAIPGPAEVNLRDAAVLKLPSGMTFLPASAAAIMVARMGNVVRPDLLGLVIGDGDWMVVLEYVADGHVPDADTSSLEAGALLRRLQRAVPDDRSRRAQGLDVLRAGRWVDAPRYDSKRHQLSWAVEYQTVDASDRVVRSSTNRTAAALGRSSRIGLNLVTESAEAGAAPLDQLLSGLRFVPGSRYEDFEAGKDKLAAFDLSQMIAD